MATVRLLKNGSEIFPAMHDSIDRAVSCVGLEMYIFADDGTGRAFRERLMSAAKRGVQVMVMVDDETLRRSRLALLHQIRQLFLQAADISRLQG